MTGTERVAMKFRDPIVKDNHGSRQGCSTISNFIE
jgi:hypothetical protein